MASPWLRGVNITETSAAEYLGGQFALVHLTGSLSTE